MDFQLVMRRILEAFERERLHYALIGGFALGVWGVTRATVDIDFLTLRDEMPKVDGVMSDLGYACRHRSENVSQYVSSESLFGEVDFLHAFRKPAMRMLADAVAKPVFQGEFSVRVLIPEDLVGLKVQAMANNPLRKTRDLADIEELLNLHGRNLDWARMLDYFALFEMTGLFEELREKLVAPD